MKLYLVSTGAGIFIGMVYAVIGVRSPAPPLVALCGLLGILFGEQVVPVGKRVLRGEPITAGWLARECVPKITGAPPTDEPKTSQPAP